MNEHELMTMAAAKEETAAAEAQKVGHKARVLELLDLVLSHRWNIAQVYSGRKGCMCGCLGTYSTNPGTITKVGKKLRENAEHVIIDDPCSLHGGCLFLQDGDTKYARYYALYLKTEAEKEQK